MNIKQASEQSGVSAPNIRFYEKEGLLTPARRQGNDYRDLEYCVATRVVRIFHFLL